MTIAHKELKVKVKVVRKANAVDPTLIEDSFFLVMASQSQCRYSFL